MGARVSALDSSLSGLEALKVSLGVWLPLLAVTLAGRGFGGDLAGVGEILEVLLITAMAILLSQLFRPLILSAEGWPDGRSGW